MDCIDPFTTGAKRNLLRSIAWRRQLNDCAGVLNINLLNRTYMGSQDLQCKPVVQGIAFLAG